MERIAVVAVSLVIGVMTSNDNSTTGTTTGNNGQLVLPGTTSGEGNDNERRDSP